MSMDKNCVILTENLHKEYRLGVIGTGTLRHDLQSWFAKKRGKEDPNRRIGMRDVADGDTFMAVDGIDLEIYRGAGSPIAAGSPACWRSAPASTPS